MDIANAADTTLSANLDSLAADVAAKVRALLVEEGLLTRPPVAAPDDDGPARLLDLSGVAHVLNVSARTVESYVASGDLPVIRLGQGRGVRRFEPAAVDALVRRNAQTVGAPRTKKAVSGTGR